MVSGTAEMVQGVSKSMTDATASVQSISANFSLILTHLISVPTRKDIKTSKGFCLVPFLFLALLFVSFIVIQVGIAGTQSGDMINPFIINTTQAQAGMILFFITCNGFLVSRISEYYKDKTEMRKKAAAYAFKVTNGIRERPTAGGSVVHPIKQETEITVPEPDTPAESDSESPPHPPSLDKPILPQTTSPPLQQVIFDNQFEYVRRLKHILPQYNKILPTFGNFIQIAVLVIEFVQLASFPYRDLLLNANFQHSLAYASGTGLADATGNQFISSIRSAFSTISSGLPEVSTLVLANIKFAIAWWISLIGVSVAVGFIGIKHLLRTSRRLREYPRVRKICKVMVEGTWILYFEPLTSIFYLILLGSFIEPLGCLSSNKQPLWPPAAGSSANESAILLQNAVSLRVEQCLPVLMNPPLQVWSTILGYIMGYYLLTIFKICDEQKPREGVITFTSRSEVLNKNGSLSLLLLYTLIPTADSTTLRGVIAIFVISIMIFYQVRIGSSYIRPINFWRTVSFLSVLWMSICVVYFTSPSQASFYGIGNPTLGYKPWMRISLTIGLGWVFILAMYAVLHVFVLRNMEKESTKPRTGISYNYNLKDEDGTLTQLVNRFTAATAEPRERVRKSMSAVGQAIGILKPVVVTAPITEVCVVNTPICDAVEPAAHGTMKSVGSSAGSESSSHVTADRAAAYNSTTRSKVQHGPRQPSLQRVSSIAEGIPAPIYNTSDVKVGVIRLTGSSVTERKSRFERVEERTSESGPAKDGNEAAKAVRVAELVDQTPVAPSESRERKARFDRIGKQVSKEASVDADEKTHGVALVAPKESLSGLIETTVPEQSANETIASGAMPEAKLARQTSSEYQSAADGIDLTHGSIAINGTTSVIFPRRQSSITPSATSSKRSSMAAGAEAGFPPRRSSLSRRSSEAIVTESPIPQRRSSLRRQASEIGVPENSGASPPILGEVQKPKKPIGPRAICPLVVPEDSESHLEDTKQPADVSKLKRPMGPRAPN
ncbi:hypothetical protein HDU98_007323 [Podochytrium sp. JEL0797]|nr:hypothetical protein HDU98_007323 [Podochytrium sp. JEL0797]